MNVSQDIFEDLYFEDIDLFNHTIKEWDLQFRQLSKGNLNASDMQFISSQFQIGYCKVDKKVEQTGTSPFGVWSFGIVIGTPIIWKGMRQLPDEIIVLKPGSEIRGLSHSEFKVLTLSIPEEVLERICEEHELVETMKFIRKNDLIKVNKSKIHEFNSLLLKLLHEIKLRPTTTSSPGFIEVCDQEIPLKLCQLIEGPGRNRKVFSSVNREIVIKKATQLVTEASIDLISVSDLCRVTGVSERTLQYAFKEYFGITPKAYLKAYLLNKAHSALSHADPYTSTIKDVAYQFGFWHMGQFAIDYKNMFGQLPSATLNCID